jgi:hypothetical protein
MAKPWVDVDHLFLLFFCTILFPLLGLELTLRPIPCLAEQGRRHHRRNPKVTIDEHGHAPYLELFFVQDLDAEEFRSHRRRPVAAQPPSTP